MVDRSPEVTGLARAFSAAEASWVVILLEAGRIRGQWVRGGASQVATAFGKRFDWHCGRLSGANKSEQKRARGKVVSHIVFVGIVCDLVGLGFDLSDGPLTFCTYMRMSDPGVHL